MSVCCDDEIDNLQARLIFIDRSRKKILSRFNRDRNYQMQAFGIHRYVIV